MLQQKAEHSVSNIKLQCTEGRGLVRDTHVREHLGNF